MGENKSREIPGLIPAIVRLFLRRRLSILLALAALSLGFVAILVTPREEEPQIVVPMADIFVRAPGADVHEVEKLVASPLEKLLWQVQGVEYVYSTSRDGVAVVTVRFYVGEDREQSLVRLYNQIRMHTDIVPPIVRGWVVKPVEIDDVPIVNLTLYSSRYNDHELRRVGEEVLSRVTDVPDVSRAVVVGGRPREIRVELSPRRMAGHGVSPMQVLGAVKAADAGVRTDGFTRNNRRIEVTADAFFRSAEDLSKVVVGVSNRRPIYLHDVATIIDGPADTHSFSRLSFSRPHLDRLGPGRSPPDVTSTEVTPAGATHAFPAVTLGFAKKPGTNAVQVARDILRRLDDLRDSAIPDGVHIEVTRNYGRTAQDKVMELLRSLFLAIVTVVALLALTMGWREAAIVGLSVPVSFSLALFVNYLLGYTVNRVTLFALILALGLVVNDPITNVDNIQRHIFMGKRKPRQATLFAVHEVLPPVLVSTLAIIIAFIPMSFITGMMGPYMAPMAANVPLTVLFSTLCALTIVPWLSFELVRQRVSGDGDSEPEEESGTTPGDVSDQEQGTSPWIRKTYRWIVAPFLDSAWKRRFVFLGLTAALIAAIFLVPTKRVPVKMLPFDNKDEFQIVVDMPEGTTLEMTDRAVRDLERRLREVPEVTTLVSYVGIASPMDFNGMVRHYYLREGGHVADIRVNLVDKDRRAMQSHEIVLRLREDIERIGRRHGASLKLVETPPGPPVLSTIVAELYASPGTPYDTLVQAAQTMQDVMTNEPFVVDIDDTSETPRDHLHFRLDKEKAGLHGISATTVTRTIGLALEGASPATCHVRGERNPLPIRLILPRSQRSNELALSEISLQAAGTKTLVPLGELGEFRSQPVNQPIYHKNLRRVVYVKAEMAGRAPGEAILAMRQHLERNRPLPETVQVRWDGEGEWKITLRVFRDLGIAFAAAILGIYILLTVQTDSFLMPVIILLAVPVTLLAILPGFWLLNQVANVPVGPFEDPVFFTATSMIGMIALGGIAIRDSLVFIDFIHGGLERGDTLREAILQTGVVRFRPILLTTLTTALGVWPITLDPIFSGLAWALIFGLTASTLFTLLIVPLTYYAFYHEGS